MSGGIADGFAQLVSRDADDLARGLSLHNRVHAATPPTFLFHTANDSAVPVQNSLLYAAALAAHNVPFELHVYPDGPHGIGMNPGFGSASDWPTPLAAWLRPYAFVTP